MGMSVLCHFVDGLTFPAMAYMTVQQFEGDQAKQDVAYTMMAFSSRGSWTAVDLIAAHLFATKMHWQWVIGMFLLAFAAIYLMQYVLLGMLGRQLEVCCEEDTYAGAED